MTDSRDFKRLVRKRMAETGESYTVARAHFEAPPVKTSKHARGAPPSVATFKRKMYARSRTKDLAPHLEQRYGFTCTGLTKLDVGVYRVDRRGAPSWIARLFPAARSIESTKGDAEILEHLKDHGFPAERTAHPDPVSMLAGQPLLVTEYVAGENRRSDESEETMRSLASMVGQLHSVPGGPGACSREAGSWHHLSVNGGSRRRDIDVLLSLFDDAEARLTSDECPLLAELRGVLEAVDDLEDLPKALIHPDPCSANVVAPDGDEGVLVDWAGAGRGPRLASFANMIGSVTALALVDAAVSGYRRHASLEPGELDRLEAALVAFPLILDCWTFLFQGEPLVVLMQRLATHRQRASAVAARARAAFAATDGEAHGSDAAKEAQATLF